MIRLLALAALACLVCRVVFGKWPWDYIDARPARGNALADARRLLGVDARADAAAIREAHRRAAGRVHPDRGGSTAGLQQVNAARDLLLSNLPAALPEHKDEP